MTHLVSCVKERDPRHQRRYRAPATAELPPGPWICAMCRPLVLDPATVEWSDSPSPSPAASSSARSLPRPASAKARRFDGRTAREAARSALGRAGNHKWRLLVAIAAAPRGLTAEEAGLAARVGYPTASTRCTDLEHEHGVVERRGERPTSSGRPAVVFHATDAGREALRGREVVAA